MKTAFDHTETKNTAWCPGCGNMPLLLIVKEALHELGLTPSQLVISSGIGQAAKMPQYLTVNFFNGLHGRALPVATGVKMANPELTVIAEGGDGDMYGEGGNHFMHTIRRNPDICHLVHNNMVYGLTKGQASPTSQRGFVTPVQVAGVLSEPFNPLLTALSLGATFVARIFVGNRELSKEVIKAAVNHKGYALVDIFDPCVSFNKINTLKWYKENTYTIEDTHVTDDFDCAVRKALESNPYPTGILYQKAKLLPTIDEQLEVYKNSRIPLYRRGVDKEKISALVSSYR